MLLNESCKCVVWLNFLIDPIRSCCFFNRDYWHHIYLFDLNILSRKIEIIFRKRTRISNLSPKNTLIKYIPARDSKNCYQILSTTMFSSFEFENDKSATPAWRHINFGFESRRVSMNSQPKSRPLQISLDNSFKNWLKKYP